MVEIEVEDSAWSAALPEAEILTEAAAYAALPPGEMRDVVILLTDDDAVRDLNVRFRSKYSATNVLSFPAPDGMGSKTSRPKRNRIFCASIGSRGWVAPKPIMCPWPLGTIRRLRPPWRFPAPRRE